MATERSGVLVNKTVTTGMPDWIHGELWVFPDGILRVPLGIRKTIIAGIKVYFSGGLLGVLVSNTLSKRKAVNNIRHFDDTTFQGMQANPKNLWIPREQIDSARLSSSGFKMNHKLEMQMADGHKVQLIWSPDKVTSMALEQVLHDWIGSNLNVV